jgi:hypothetical protein
MAGESCIVDIAFIKANSSCLIMMLRQGTCNKENNSLSACCSFSILVLKNQYLLPVDSTQTGSDLSGHSTKHLLLSPSASNPLNNPDESAEQSLLSWLSNFWNAAFMACKDFQPLN